jgi:glycosyltransferase involved in cell wall biosynthesis
MPHGVDFELFSAFGASHLPKPRDFEKVRPPIIGFYGLIQDWLDFELIAKIAKSHPEWSIALIGKVATDISEIRDYSNIYLLGEKPYKDLPNYSRLFDVAIIPYNVADKRMETVNPTKLLQYIACGLPVVSVDLPEVRNYSKVVYVASSHEEFIKNIEKALKENSQERRQIRQLMAKDETWQRRVEKISEIISNEANPDTMSGLGRI